MKIAIHYNGDSFFCKGWVNYCKENAIDYKIVNCYDTNFIAKITDCDALMWHHDNNTYADQIFAKQLLYSIERMGKKVFPDFNTSWHFDDKVGQKYLFEALNIPAAKSYAFYSKAEALKWVEQTSFPKVFKLRGGAGSQNVELITNLTKARKYVSKAFGRGFSQFNSKRYFILTLNKYQGHRTSLLSLIKAFVRLFISTKYSKEANREKGYIYFQDFIPANSFDIRVVVTGNKAFAIKRMVRKNDFRASGSGHIIYNKDEIDINCVKLAFEANNKLQTQSVAFDFVFDSDTNPLIVEISFGYEIDRYYDCPGYWDNNLVWHDEKIDPTAWMIQEIISKIKS